MIMQIKSPWLQDVYQQMILPRRARIASHPFVIAMQSGSCEFRQAEQFFSGLQWHLMEFGAHVKHLIEKRPPEVIRVLEGRSEDKDGDTEILARIVRKFGGPSALINEQPWRYRPHSVWVYHDALLRSAIYSRDLSWQVGTAALNIGIESLVPYMIEPLFRAAVERYGVTANDAAWLASRSGEDERQHGENGFILLDQFVRADQTILIDQCRFFIDSLSRSMAYGLLQSGLEN